MTGGFIRSMRIVREPPPPDAYPFSIPALRALDVLELDPAVTFVVGGNGSGKSTLIEALAVAAGMNAEGGGRNFRFGAGDSRVALADHVRLERGVNWPPRTDFFLRAESFFNLASELDEIADEPMLAAYGGRSLHEVSHGESFLALAVNRFAPRGLYLLDEPEAALSPQGQLALLARMLELVKDACQFVVATHSPLLLAFPGARILELSDEGVSQIAYDDAEQVRLYRSFLRDPERYLRLLT
jgi:predicted ATPase